MGQTQLDAALRVSGVLISPIDGVRQLWDISPVPGLTDNVSVRV
jgi:hypothetical protein